MAVILSAEAYFLFVAGFLMGFFFEVAFFAAFFFILSIAVFTGFFFAVDFPFALEAFDFDFAPFFPIAAVSLFTGVGLTAGIGLAFSGFTLGAVVGVTEVVAASF